MDWANVTKIHAPPSAKRYSRPTPGEHSPYKDNFATGNVFQTKRSELTENSGVKKKQLLVSIKD